MKDFFIFLFVLLSLEGVGMPAGATELPADAFTATRTEDALIYLSQKFWDEVNCAPTAKENLVICPISFWGNMSLLSNGAETSLENALRIGSDVNLNNFFKTFLNEMNDSTLRMSSSVWANQSFFNLSDKFVKIAKNCYDAEAYTRKFDSATETLINEWINQNTGGLITSSVKLYPNLACLILNTIMFDGVWQEKYVEVNISPGSFILRNGEEVQVNYLRSEENSYFETEGACGFSKNYENGFKFIAVLPNEESDCFNLNLSEVLKRANESNEKAIVSIPEFEFGTNKELDSIASNIGLGAILSNLCNLTSTRERAFVSRIFQSLRVKLDANGTKASALTLTETSFGLKFETKKVILNRWFEFVICDPMGIPIFIGRVENPSKN